MGRFKRAKVVVPCSFDSEKFQGLFNRFFNKAVNECIHIGAAKEDPHCVSEVMCWKCGKRWIAAYPAETLLKQLECPDCGCTGYAFATGQDIEKDANLKGEMDND